MKNKDLSIAVVLGMTATGLSVARSLGRKGIRVYGLESTRREPGMFSRYVRPRIVPNVIKNELEFVNYLLDFGKKLNRPAVLFPAGDEYLDALSRHREELAVYYKFNIPSKDIVKNFLDKRRSYEIAAQNGLSCPATYLVKNTEDIEKLKDKISFPSAIKPAISHLWRLKFGGKKLIPVNSYDELLSTFAEIKREYPEVMMQELIQGGDDAIYLFYFYCNAQKELTAFFVPRKLRQHPINFGIGTYCVSEKNRDVIEIGKSFLAKLGYSGIGALELKRDARDGKFKFLELNMRFIMIGELAIAGGVDLPYIAYCDIIGRPLETIADFRENVRLLNLELDLGSFWQYKKIGKITLKKYLRSFLGGRTVHTYFSWRDPEPSLFIAKRFFKNILRKSIRSIKTSFNEKKDKFATEISGWLKNYYRKSSPGTRNFAKKAVCLIPLKKRLGKKFFEELSFLEKSQWWSKAEIENYQNEKLRELIKHSYENVPYYNRLFKENGLYPSDIKTIKDLAKIPLLDKETLRNDPESFIARNYDRRGLVSVSTSGTSGKVIVIYFDPRKEYFNGGPFEWRFFRWAGYDLGDCCAIFRANIIPKNSFGGIYEYNPAQKRVLFSIYRMNEKNLEHYIKGLRSFPFKALQGYSTPLKTLAEMFLKNNVKTPVQPKAVLTLAEMLLPEQRKLIEGYFQCRVFDWYAMEERAVAACECENHTGHHINSEFCVTEFIKDGLDTDGRLEIVSTGLTNFAMPFIRYKTGDYGEPIEMPCACGRNLPLMKLLGGRNRCFVTNKKGKKMFVIGGMDKFHDLVSDYQYVQEAIGRINVKIVPRRSFYEEEKKKLAGFLYEKLGEDFDIKLSLVDGIKKGPNGKTPLVIYPPAEGFDGGLYEDSAYALQKS